MMAMMMTTTEILNFVANFVGIVGIRFSVEWKL